ncbi:unnamed protein product [[Candida] boidinii]|nr:unnamed protein product [[Candida] boidinii]
MAAPPPSVVQGGVPMNPMQQQQQPQPQPIQPQVMQKPVINHYAPVAKSPQPATSNSRSLYTPVNGQNSNDSKTGFLAPPPPPIGGKPPSIGSPVFGPQSPSLPAVFKFEKSIPNN